MDPVQTMPDVNSLVKNSFEIKDWLKYYENIWKRNLTARLVDIETDLALKATNPDLEVVNDDGAQMPVKARLEHRKILAQDAVNILDKFAKLLALTPGELLTKYNPDALKIADDMLPKKPVESVDQETKKYKVLKDIKGDDDKIIYAVGSVVELTSSQVGGYVEGGAMIEDGQPSGEAKV